MIGDDLGNHNMQTPLFSYQCNEEGVAWIYTMGNFTGSTSTGVDIDQTTNMCYSAYNYNEYNSVSGDMNLYVYIMDFNTWDEFSGYPIHNDTSEAFINSTGNDNVIDILIFPDQEINYKFKRQGTNYIATFDAWGIPRHPTQIYEALAYFLIFLLLLGYIIKTMLSYLGDFYLVCS